MKSNADADNETRELAFLESSLAQNQNLCVVAYRAVDDGQDFEFVTVNESLERVEKVSRDELVGRRVTEVFPGVEAFGLLDVFRRVYRSGKSERFRGCAYRDDRIIGWRETFVSKLPDSGIVVATYDSGRQLREILDGIFGFVGLYLPDGTLIETNQAPLDAANLSRDEVLGKPFWESYWWSHSKDVQNQIKESLMRAAAGETVRQDVSVRIADDQTMIIDVTFGPLHDEAGEVTRLLGFGVDITERKRAEEELRRSERKYHRIVDTTTEGFSRVDEETRIVEVNDALCRMLGYQRDEILGKRQFELEEGTEDPGLETRSKGDEHLATEATNREVRFRRRDGSILEARVSASEIYDEEGNSAGRFSFVTDITQQKEHEAQLYQAQKMEAVGQLTGGVAHEFNNLLMVILGNLEVLESRLGKDSPLRSFTSSAMQGVLRGAELTQSLLTFSRKQQLEVGEIDFNGLVLGMQNLFQRTLGETITIETDLAEDLWLTSADAGQTEAALLNFVLNARDAMPRGGTISVVTYNRVMTADTAAHHDYCAGPGDYVTLEVRDSGTGMTEDQVEHAFEPFYTTKEVGEGTGLGLSVAYGFAKQSGGCLEIESEPGQGTTIRLSLPRAVAEAVVREAGLRQPTEAVTGSGRILVLEDDADVLRLVCRQLTKLGYEVVEAEHGPAALALLDENPDIDLLFSDVVLPGRMSGPEVAARARIKHPNLNVLLTSGYPEKDVERLAVGGRDVAILRKPYRGFELANAIAAAMTCE